MPPSGIHGKSSKILVFPKPPSHRNFPAVSLRALPRVIGWAFLSLLVLSSPGLCAAQNDLPFQVSNPRHQKWPEDEASRIYQSACEMVAQAIRPEQPPHLHPKFVLVLGAGDNEAVRYGETSELRLKKWDSTRFAQAVVIMATREVLPTDEIQGMVRNLVLSSQATISVADLKQGH